MAATGRGGLGLCLLGLGVRGLFLQTGSASTMECPVTFDQYRESGEQQPLMLPACGHTICKRAVTRLVSQAQSQRGSREVSVAIKCPCCAQRQPKVRRVNICLS